MNIFFLALNPKLAAVQHLDKHVVKMILETAQLLCTTHHILRQENAEIYKSMIRDAENVTDDIPYKATHVNHPSSIWLRQQKSHYMWLSRLGVELVKEYEYRYAPNGEKTHKVKPIIEWLAENVPPYKDEQDTEFWAPPPCMPVECKVKKEGEHYGFDSIQSYHMYYVREKRDFATWKRRDPPKWFLDMCEEQNLVWPVPKEVIQEKRKAAKAERERKRAVREARAKAKALKESNKKAKTKNAAQKTTKVRRLKRKIEATTESLQDTHIEGQTIAQRLKRRRVATEETV